MISRLGMLILLLIVASAMSQPKAFAARTKPAAPSDEAICTGVQVTVYDGCRKQGGSEDHCWMYGRQKYKDCMAEKALNKRLLQERKDAGDDSPPMKTGTTQPLPKKSIDSFQAKPSPSPTPKKRLPSPLPKKNN